MSAVIPALLERGWDPVTPVRWIMEDGTEWRFFDAGYSDVSALNDTQLFSWTLTVPRRSFCGRLLNNTSAGVVLARAWISILFYCF